MDISDCFNQFLILMYKNLLLKKQHFFKTVFYEILLPILISSIPVLIITTQHSDRNKDEMGKSATTYDPFSPFEDNSPISNSTTFFFYVPTEKADFFIVAFEYWKRKRLPDPPDFDIVVQGFNTEVHLEHAEKSKSMFDSVVGTVFQRIEGNKLHYKIRCRSLKSSNFHTDNPLHLSDKPLEENIYRESMFISWQTAIEQTFIEMKNKDAKFEVNMQRFPYPASEEHEVEMEDLLFYFFIGSSILLEMMIMWIIEEKASCFKEMLKMMGMTDLNYWLSNFVTYLIEGLIVMLVIAIIYTSPMPGWKFHQKTELSLLFVLFLLFFCSTLLMAFIATILFNKVYLAILCFLVIHFVPFLLLDIYYFSNYNKETLYLTLSQSSVIGMCLIPGGAIQIAFKMISTLSKSGGATWKNLYSISVFPGINFVIILTLMLVSSAIFCIIIWYLNAVWPWQYGVPKPFYFPFTKSYWFSCMEASDVEKAELDTNTDYFESDPSGITPEIVIKNLSKEFKVGLHSKCALDNVSLNIYSGEITALLGRNGAGKSTLINMLTGFYPLQSGLVFINGWDIRINIAYVRKQLGICPQDNILLPSLTVIDNLKIIAGMKGVKWSNMAPELERVVKLVNLTEKQNTLSQDLSGGMKRRLSFALAIVGNSQVLFLDEPTSGLDPESRRNLWDILLNIRHDKTIILCTHYMEEADILADRIAIMVNGQIKCCGSPVYLKQKFGAGYQLIIECEENCNINAVTTLLKEFVPVTLVDRNDKELKYSFQNINSGDRFAKMFKALEATKSKLGVVSVGLSATTMDHVFHRINTMESGESDLKTDVQNDGFLIPTKNRATGVRLWLNCVQAIITKRFCYARRHLSIFFTQVLIPFAMLCAYLAICNSFEKERIQPPLQLDMRDIYGATQAIYHRPEDIQSQVFYDTYYIPLLREKGVWNIRESNNIQQYLLEFGGSNLITYLRTFLVGANTEPDNSGLLKVTTWYNGELYQGLPISLNLMHTAILRSFTGDNDAEIIVTNSPFLSISNAFINLFVKDYQLRAITALFIPLVVTFPAASYAAVAIQECSSRAKLLQLMSGISSYTYWFAMFLWDMMVYTFFCILFIIPFAIFEGLTFFDFPNAIGSVLLLFILFGWSSIPMGYILSRWVEKPSTGFSILLCFNFLIGLIVPSLFVILDKFYRLHDNILPAVVVFRILPIFSVTWGFTKLMPIAFDNSFCASFPSNLLKSFCVKKDLPKIILQCCTEICGKDCHQLACITGFDEEKCGIEAFFLFLDGVLCFLILFLFETGLPGKACEYLVSQKPQRTVAFVLDNQKEDSDVLYEIQQIQDSNLQMSSREAFVVRDLKKKFGALHAVDGLSFGVCKPGCFGLLGVNGAGKTTTFRMLCGDILPTEGNAFIGGYDLKTDLKKFQSHIGYCPQFDAVIDLLTGREMLRLLAYLHGIPSQNVEQYVNNIIYGIDFQDQADKLTYQYSGGTKRKLSLGLALVGYLPVILLDEPTSGMDPVSRKKIWSILSSDQVATRAAVILSTHSMEECETLCSRLAIMARGRLRCLGTIQHLKSKYCQGFTIIMKFENRGNIQSDVIDTAKKEFLRFFPSGTLNKCHQGVLDFHIMDSLLSWSYLFESMEVLKEKLQLEDYFISGTTLEQLFLSFAHE